jgi:hypothetical protein
LKEERVREESRRERKAEKDWECMRVRVRASESASEWERVSEWEWVGEWVRESEREHGFARHNRFAHSNFFRNR